MNSYITTQICFGKQHNENIALLMITEPNIEGGALYGNLHHHVKYCDSLIRTIASQQRHTYDKIQI